MQVQITGSVCALITPFTELEQLDFAALEGLVEAQIRGGTHALVIGGSTGESVALEETELAELLRAAVRFAGGRIQIVAGTGAASTEKSLRLTRLARDCGANAALVVTPAYVRPSQEGLSQHFSRIAERGGLPIVLYNVPARTACDLLPATVARLAKLPQVIGIKEAVPERARMLDLLALQDADFSVLSGDDPTALDAFKMGARGLVSVAANPLPAAMRELWNLSQSGNWQHAEQLNERLAPVFAALALESNPIPVKWAMHGLAYCGPAIRSPLCTLGVAHQHAVMGALAAFNARRLAA